jgi:hypothetical protein
LHKSLLYMGLSDNMRVKEGREKDNNDDVKKESKRERKKRMHTERENERNDGGSHGIINEHHCVRHDRPEQIDICVRVGLPSINCQDEKNKGGGKANQKNK